MLHNKGYRHTFRICIIAFPRQRWLLERTSMYIACLVLGAFVYSRKAPVNFVMSVRLSSCISAAPTGRISPNVYIGIFFLICPETPVFG